MTKRRNRKPYTVEWRAKDGQLFRDWSVYSRYKTEKDRDKGLRALLHSGCPWFEYRAGQPKKLNKIEVGKMKFGEAIEAAKNGEMVARKGWNGKGMWITYSPGSVVPAERFWAQRNKEYAEQTGGCASVLPCLTMKTATGEILMGWLASQSDMLSDDWEIVGPQITRRLY